MSYENLKPEQVAEVLEEFQKHLQGKDNKIMSYERTYVLGALEYAKRIMHGLIIANQKYI